MRGADPPPPHLPAYRRALLSLRIPVLLAQMARLMLEPSPHLARTYGIPRSVYRDAYRHNPLHRARLVRAVAKLHSLCEELELLHPVAAWLWRRAGLVGSAPLG